MTTAAPASVTVADLDNAPLPTNEEGVLAELTRLRAIVSVADAAHRRIGRVCIAGQEMSPRVTQERMALAVGVTGPRVNAIIKRARRDDMPTERAPKVTGP